MTTTINWDAYFMNLAYNVSMKSKDKSTFAGTIIVGEGNEIKTTGYNAFPRGWDDTDPKNYEKPFKYQITEHSERNAIFNAARIGVSLLGCKLYVPWIPCVDCARAIVNTGIAEIIIHWHHPRTQEFFFNTKEFFWRESNELAIKIMEKGGVNIRYWDGDLPKLVVLSDGKQIEF